jgi:phage terminase large subunit GpA-like protein
MLIDRRAFLDGLRPQEPLTVSQWADRFRRLSSKASAEPGPWKTSRTPYLRGIMDVLSAQDPTQRVVVIAGAQLGKTESGLNWLGYVVAHAPGPMLLVQPTVEMGTRLVKQRLNSLIAETPALAERIASPRSRDSGNTMTSKEFPGGMLLVTGANSATGLRSTPCRYIFADEIDAFPQDVDGEGDPLSLAEKRSTTFGRRKVLMTSTPTVKGVSRIEAEYELSDQRRYFVPCPHCKHMQYLRWANVRWNDGEPHTAAYACESCGTLIEERYKTWMLTRGEWQATAPGDGKTAGFHISSLYSPLGWKSWGDCVAEFLRAKNDAPSLKVWVNTVLGETFEEEYAARLGSEGLMARAEFYEPGVVPEGGLVVTVGVDVQANRLAIVMMAWGREEEAWVLSHQEIFGDPSRAELWQQLDEVVTRPVRYACGHERTPDVVAIDSGGHFTHEAYQFARERRRYGVIAIKGQSVRGKPVIGKPTKVDVNFKGKVLKKAGMVYPVGSDTVKSTLYGRLSYNQPGPGFVHFHHELTPQFYDELTSEKQVVRYVKGFPVREWVKKDSQRNEALDCVVYAYAGLNALYQMYNRATIWEQFERKLGTAPEKPLPVTQPKARIRPAPTSSFVTGW